MHTLLTETPVKLEGTEWTVTEMLPISLSGPLTDIKLGNARVAHGGGERDRRFGWRARRVENHWDVMRDGERKIDGRVLANDEPFPFMIDDADNTALVNFISDWLDEEFNVKSSPPKPAPPPAPLNIPKPAIQNPTTIPPPVLQGPLAVNPKSLADRVAEKVCEIYGTTVADMRNSDNRGLYTLVRQIITYLLRELGQKNPVILAAIGAAKKATGLIYINHKRITGLLKTDAVLRVKVEALLKEFRPPTLTVGQSIVPTSLPHSQNGNGLFGRITSLVSEAALVPVLIGSGTSTLDLGPARIARACLIFDLYRDIILKRIPSETSLPVSEVEKQMAEALDQLRQSDSEVLRIVSEVKKRLKPTV